uniref:Uncharacterized protein n=1 Tax=Anguilla anguilla TaxID=7936 RepID=A0A0E9T130_ANGAN
MHKNTEQSNALKMENFGNGWVIFPYVLNSPYTILTKWLKLASNHCLESYPVLCFFWC